jgi:pSer/pThr/pTyr-binding forkhead associated (FHA) protein
VTPGDPKPTSGKLGEDPYTKYLDLPAGARPPSMYQLLQLEVFCSEPERIKHAARKQFRRIKPFEDHPNRHMREAIQDIMTQIATARVVLCDPERKLEYDQALAAEMGVDLDQFLADRMAVPVPECFVQVTAGPSSVGEEIDLLEGDVTTIGSDPQCVITLPSPRVAKLHCQLEYQQNDREWMVTHVAKGKVTLVNDQRVQEFVLAEGDRIDVGGFRLRLVRRPVSEVKEVLPPPMSLIIRKGPSIPAPIMNVIPPETVLIGHCDTALWQLAGPLCSRHHCRIQPDGDRWVIEDLRSTNGIELNGKKVEKARLKSRDQLTIGRFEILVSLRH